MRFLYLRTVFWFGIKSGGSVGHTSGVINALSRIVNVDVISNDNLVGVRSKIKIISPGLLKLIPIRLGELFYNLVLIKRIKEIAENYDYIYQRSSGLSFTGAYLSKKFGIPLILEFNSSDVWLLKHFSKRPFWIASFSAKIINSLKIPIIRRIEEYNLNNSTLIVAVSAPLKELLMERGVAEQKIMVNPNGVDPESHNPLIKPNNIKKKYSLENYKVIGFIGTFGQWHGVIEMARAIELFFDSNPKMTNEVKFLLIGDGRFFPKVKRIISISGYQRNVIFTGKILQIESPKYLSACDILLAPHVKNEDGSTFFGSPTKLFEYMAMGKAIIASNLGQLGEVLEHGKTALLVEPGNVEQLAETMQLLLRNSKLRENLGQNALSEVLKKNTWEKHVNRLLARIADMSRS